MSDAAMIAVGLYALGAWFALATERMIPGAMDGWLGWGNSLFVAVGWPIISLALLFATLADLARTAFRRRRPTPTPEEPRHG